MRHLIQNTPLSSRREFWPEISGEPFCTISNIGFFLVAWRHKDYATLFAGTASAVSHAFPLKIWHHLDILSVCLVMAKVIANHNAVIKNPTVIKYGAFSILLNVADTIFTKNNVRSVNPYLHCLWHILAAIALNQFNLAMARELRQKALFEQVKLSQQTMIDPVDTLFFQGINSSQTQILKYTGTREVSATTGENMHSKGRNGLLPLSIIYAPYLSPENPDIALFGLALFSPKNLFQLPLNVTSLFISFFSNIYYGCQFSGTHRTTESVKAHTVKLFEISVGQDADIAAHKAKYDDWKRKNPIRKKLILFGVSRGTAATFCAYTKHQYPEVKLVVLEGAIDSIPDVFRNRAARYTHSRTMQNFAVGAVNKALSIFTKFKPDGISPIACVDQYPENVPTVFITSKIDNEVPCENTKRIAQALANRGKNEVYLLVLENSSHPAYMYDNESDRNKYEAFIHAIYEKYELPFDSVLAKIGKQYVDGCLLQPAASTQMKSTSLGR